MPYSTPTFLAIIVLLENVKLKLEFFILSLVLLLDFTPDFNKKSKEGKKRYE